MMRRGNNRAARASSGCPACSHPKAKPYEGRGKPRYNNCVVVCERCEAVYTEDGSAMYLGESYGIVSPNFTADPGADSRARYFDFTTVGSGGKDRRHGWFDPETGLMTQSG